MGYPIKKPPLFITKETKFIIVEFVINRLISIIKIFNPFFLIDGILKRRFSQQVIDENSEGESDEDDLLEDELLETDTSNFDDALQKKFKI